MLVPFDTSFMLGVVGILLIILTPLLIVWDKIPLLGLIRGIDKDLASANKPLIDKAKKYSHGKNPSGKKLIIHRLLGNFPEEKNNPNFIAAVAGMAVIGWIYCLFWGIVSFIYSGEKNDSLIDWILISGQISLFVELIVYWFGKTFPVMQPTLFLLNSLFLLVLCVLLGALLSFSGLYFHVLSISSIKWFYLGTLLVPLAPIIMTFREIVHYTIQELKKYRQLKDSVLDFEKFRKESGRRS